MAARPPAVARPLTLVDLMILVAATALGCAGILRFGITAGELSSLFADVIAGRWSGELGLQLAILSLPFGLAWTLALIALRLRRPRPPWRILARQPGFLAACMAGLAFAGLLLPLLGGILLGVAPSDRVQVLAAASFGLAAAAMLSGAWLTLIVTRRWRAERSWPDRLGRALGAYWIAQGAVAAIVILFWLQ